MLKILIKFPSRERPEQFRKALTQYAAKASDLKNIHFLFTLDSDDKTIDAYTRIIENSGVENTTVIGVSTGKIDAVNRDLNDFLKGHNPDIILLASDDMIPISNGYDRIIRDKAEELGLDRVFWFHDSNQARLNTLCILGIEYYKRFNYLYHHSYKSLWCDNEFHEIALRLEKMNKVPYDVIIEHQHPLHNRKYQMDELYKKNDVHWTVDMDNFNKRKSLNFQ